MEGTEIIFEGLAHTIGQTVILGMYIELIFKNQKKQQQRKRVISRLALWIKHHDVFLSRHLFLLLFRTPFGFFFFFIP